jgi:rod shape-determining protein MreD
MIMPRGQQLLLPANPLFIATSLTLALLLNMLQNMGLFGNAAGVPDFLALVLLFWTVHQPFRVSLGWAFFFGLITDVHEVALLGQHALSYTVMAYLATLIHRRLLWFRGSSQALQVLPLFVVAHALSWTARLLTGNTFPGAWALLAPLLEAALWPVISVLLLAPQRRAPNPDENRPL